MKLPVIVIPPHARAIAKPGEGPGSGGSAFSWSQASAQLAGTFPTSEESQAVGQNVELGCVDISPIKES